MMKRLLSASSLLLLLCAGVIVAAGSLLVAAPQAPTMKAQPPARIQAVPNTLSAAEKTAGWRLLFNGTTTAGWRGFKKTEMTAGWTVEDGALTRSAAGGDIVTLDEFANFELTFDWKIAVNGNSGVFGRVGEESTSVWHTATEYQILDNKGHADGKIPETSAASVYALYAPSKDMTKEPGEWNQSKIVMNGAHVEHWLNGMKVVEFELTSPAFASLVEKSKFKPFAQFGKLAKGRIAIQDHGDKVSYRNIKIRAL
jgi:hypothetical protein